MSPFTRDIQLSLHRLSKKTIVSPLNCLGNFVENQLTTDRFIGGFLICPIDLMSTFMPVPCAI